MKYRIVVLKNQEATNRSRQLNHIITNKAPADTADVVMRLQKTRNSEYLKYSFSGP